MFKVFEENYNFFFVSVGCVDGGDWWADLESAANVVITVQAGQDDLGYEFLGHVVVLELLRRHRRLLAHQIFCENNTSLQNKLIDLLALVFHEPFVSVSRVTTNRKSFKQCIILYFYFLIFL